MNTYMTTNSAQHSQYRADVSCRYRGSWQIEIFVKVSYDGATYGLDFKKGDYVSCGIRHCTSKIKATKNAKWLVDHNNEPVLPY